MTGRASGPTSLVTGGAGFIGTNLADRLAAEGGQVVVVDDLSRAGVAGNLEHLVRVHGSRVRHVHADVRDRRALREALVGVDQVFHLAAQVAVTTSVLDPVADFEVNATGTLALLEELRAISEPPPLLFSSTNKVYGGMEALELERADGRYAPVDADVRAHGIGEDWPLRFVSPYGCSKGAADQYVLDYAHTYGLRSVVFRMSCVYGQHQCGNEDQGWVAHFVLQARDGKDVTVYGDGRQVRDVLHVDDWLEAAALAMEHVDDLAGQAFNIGGGPGHVLSLLELLDLLGELDRRPDTSFDDWRVGDQRYYVSDTRRFQQATGWAPQIGPREGVARLHAWAGSRVGVA